MHAPTSASTSSSSGAGDEIAMVPSSVGRVSRDWDEQDVDLRAAAEQIAHAPTSGFTPPVTRAAADFLRAWTAHAGAAAALCDHEADDLRSVLGAWRSADAEVAARMLALLGYDEGPR